MAPHWPRLVKIMNNASRLWFLVFCLTDLQTTLLAARSSELIMSAKAGETCDMKHDVLLVEDSSSENSYLQCRPAGRGLGGFWERVSCQPGQKFFFTDQRCENNPHHKPKSLPMMPSTESTTPTTTTIRTVAVEEITNYESTTATTVQEDEEATTTSAKVLFNEDITTLFLSTPSTEMSTSMVTSATSGAVKVEAFLNDSCSNGERCRGGTICDQGTERCVCLPGFINTIGTKLCKFVPLTTTTAITTTMMSTTTSVQPAIETTTALQLEAETTTSGQTVSATAPPAKANKYTIALDMFTQTSQKLISPGTSCKDRNVQCGYGSYCNPDNEVCSCPADTADEGGICIHLKISAALSERCDKNTKCTGWSVCIQNVCRCQPPLIQNGLQCVPPDSAEQPKLQAKPGQHCDKGQICIGGSVCSTATMLCTCPVGSQDIGDSCMQLTGFGSVKTSIGQICTSNLDCILGAFCSPASSPPTCQCLSTHVAINSACFKIINPGVKGCDYDEQCSASYQGAKCSLGTCICPTGLTAQSESCKPVTLNPGQVCENNETCFGGATCFHNVCVCPLGFVAFGANCVPKHLNSDNSIAIGETCSSTANTEAMCSNGSQCIGEICLCPSNTFYINGSCIIIDDKDTNEALIFPLEKYLGLFMFNVTQIDSNPPLFQHGSCSNKRCGLNEFCINGLCECMDGFVKMNGTCGSKYLTIGQPCIKGQVCAGGSDCLLGTCTCLSGLKNENGKCVAMTNFKIECPLGTTLVGDSCQNMTQEDVITETLCTDVRQCGRGFLCMNNMCTCPPGTRKKFGQCWRNPGGNCSHGEVCDGCSICLQNVCQCSGNVAPVNGVCSSNIAKPNERCNAGQCCISGSECIQGICICPPGTTLINHECSTSTITSPPFGSCSSGQMCIGGSTCLQGICMCATNQIILSNQCRDVVNNNAPSPGESCNVQLDRCTGGAVCDGKVCTCPQGQTPVEKQCIPSIPGIPGDLCSDTYPCIPGVICMNNICQCPAHQVWSLDKCINNGNLVKPGGICSRTENCSANLTCQNNRCLCSTNQVLVDTECKQRLVQPNQQCQAPQECIGNSQCLQGFCLCPVNTIPVDGICILAFPGPGESCAPNFSQCTGGSYCNSNLCLCPLGQKSLNGICIGAKVVVLPGQVCDKNVNECTGGSSCIKNVCTCNQEQIEINHTCKPKTLLPNMECHPLQQCTGGSQCLEGICLCPANLIVSSFGVCTSLSPGPGENCDMNFSLCTGGSSCIQSVCTCPSSYFPINGICTNGGVPSIKANLNEFCDPNYNQCTGGSICNNTICTCPKGTIAFGNTCQYVTTQQNLSCIFSHQCNNGAVCMSGFCTCPAGTLIINNTCEIIPGPGQSCNPNLPICTGGATCMNFICTCPLLNRPINGKCNVAKPGDACNPESYECLDWSECSPDNRCTCQNKRILINSKCIDPDIQPGGICSLNDICSGGSVCINGICQCPSGFVQGLNNRCMLPENLSPGQKCTAFQVCTGNSLCINGQCRCPGDLQPVNGICSTLLQTAGPGQSCKNGQTCSGGSYCIKGICVCPQNQVAKGSVCEFVSNNNVVPGGPCTDNFQCGGGTSCVNGKCICPVFAMVYSNQCIPRQVQAGKSCILFVQTCIGGSRCLGNICVCPQNYIVSQGLCKFQPRSYFAVNNSPSVTTYDQQYHKLEVQCTSSRTCPGGSVCINGLCECPNGFSRVQDNCVKFVQQSEDRRPPGTWCTNSKQCTGHSLCKHSVCVCQPQSTVIAGKCVQLISNKASVNDSCLTTNNCMDGLVCLFGFCQCLNNMTCAGLSHFTSPPGGSCAALQRCSGGSVCRSGWCVCPEASMFVTNGFCLPSSSNTMFPMPGQKASVLETIDETADEEESSSADETLSISDLVPQTELQQQPSGGQPLLTTGQIQPVLTNTSVQQQGGQALVNNGQMQPVLVNSSLQGGQGTLFGYQPTGVIQTQTAGNKTMFPNGGQPIVTNPSTFPQPPTSQLKTLTNNSVLTVGQQAILPVNQNSFVDGQQQQQNANNSPNPSPFVQPPQIYNTSSNVLAPGSLIIGSPSSNSFISPPLPSGVGVINPTAATGLNSANSNNFGFQGKRQYAKPGGVCDISTICTGGSKCILGMCLCEDQFEVIGPVCVRKVPPITPSPPMGSCQNGEACTGGAICDGQVCQCMPGTELVNNACQQIQLPQGTGVLPSAVTRRPTFAIVVVPPLSTCANGERCGGNSMCNRVTYICECPGDTQPIQGHCVSLLINKNRLPIQQQQKSNGDSSQETPAMPLPVASAWTSLGAMNIASGGNTGGFMGRSEIYPKTYTIAEVIDKTGPAIFHGNYNYNNNNNNNGQFLPPAGIFGREITQIKPMPRTDMTETDEQPHIVEVASPPNGVCGRGRVCTGGSFCVHFKCRCPEGSSVNEFDICQSSTGTSSNAVMSTTQLGKVCNEQTTCAGSAQCISGRCRCPPGTMQDGPVCISLKDSGKTRFFGTSILHADATSVCPNGAEPVKTINTGDYKRCDASRPSDCPWGWYCYATDKALEGGPYYCCPSSS